MKDGKWLRDERVRDRGTEGSRPEKTKSPTSAISKMVLYLSHNHYVYSNKTTRFCGVIYITLLYKTSIFIYSSTIIKIEENVDITFFIYKVSRVTKTK